MKRPNRLRSIVTLCAVAGWLSSATAGAEIERSITGNRVRFGDLVADAPPEILELDLGSAPPVGASRLYSRAELAAAARQAGKPTVVRDSVRAVRATTRWSQTEFLALLTPRLTAVLPDHAKLLRVEVPKSLVTAASIEIVKIALGQIPSRRGNVQTSAVAELGIGGAVEQRLTLPVFLLLGEPPKPIEVDHGTNVTLVVNLGSTRVSAAATLMQTAPVGSVCLFRVVKTRKTLRAKLLSTSTAEVVTE